MIIRGQSQAKFDELDKYHLMMNIISCRKDKNDHHSAIQLHIHGLHLKCNLISGLIFTLLAEPKSQNRVGSYCNM